MEDAHPDGETALEAETRNLQARMAIPVNRLLQAIFKTYLGFVAQTLFRRGNVPQRMLDVAAALRAIDGGSGVGGKCLQEFEGLIECDSAPRRHVEYLARHLLCGSFAGQQVSLDGVVDVSEITALLAVAKHRRLLP